MSSTDGDLMQLFTSGLLGSHPYELVNRLDIMVVMQHTFWVGSQGDRVREVFHTGGDGGIGENTWWTNDVCKDTVCLFGLFTIYWTRKWKFPQNKKRVVAQIASPSPPSTSDIFFFLDFCYHVLEMCSSWQQHSSYTFKDSLCFHFQKSALTWGLDTMHLHQEIFKISNKYHSFNFFSPDFDRAHTTSHHKSNFTI